MSLNISVNGPRVPQALGRFREPRVKPRSGLPQARGQRIPAACRASGLVRQTRYASPGEEPLEWKEPTWPGLEPGGGTDGLEHWTQLGRTAGLAKAGAVAAAQHPERAHGDHRPHGLTAAQGAGGRRRGPAVAPPRPQVALQLPQLLLLLPHRVLPLPARLAAQVLLAAQASGRLGDLQLQRQLPLQAAQGVLRGEMRRGRGRQGARGPWGHREQPRPGVPDPALSRPPGAEGGVMGGAHEHSCPPRKLGHPSLPAEPSRAGTR